MKKRIFALALAGIVMLMSAAMVVSCKKNGTEDDENRPEEQTNLRTEVNSDRIESKTLAGEKQTDSHGNQIYDTFSYEDIDNETVALVGYRAETVGTVVNGVVQSYVQCHESHEVVIPSKYGRKTVAEIGESVFASLAEVRTVIIPDTVRKIGAYAFANCSQLMKIDLPAALSEMGEGAFYQCTRLASVNFSKATGLETLPSAAFQNCTALTALTVPGTVHTIGRGAFFGCSGIVTLVLEEGVVTIQEQAFQNLTALTTVTLPASLTELNSVDAETGSKTHTNFYGCPNLFAENVTVPAESAAEAYFAELELKSINEEEPTTFADITLPPEPSTN